MTQQETNPAGGDAQNQQARDLVAHAREKLTRNDALGSLALLKEVVGVACGPAIKSEAAKLLAAAGANADAIACYMQAGKSFLFEHTDVLRARQAFAAAHALDPNDLEVIFQMGLADVAEGHTQDGLAKFIDILRRSNLKHVPALFEAGCIYQVNAQSDQAILAFKKVLDRDKHHIQAMVHMGQLVQSKGLKLEAIGYFLDAADTSREQKQLGSARQLASTVLTMDGGNARARSMIEQLDKEDPSLAVAVRAKPNVPAAKQEAPSVQPETPSAQAGAPSAQPDVVFRSSVARSNVPASAPPAAPAPKAVPPDPEREAAYLSLKQMEARRKQAQESLQTLLQSSEELERVLGEQRGLLESAMRRKSDLDREIAERTAALEGARASSFEAEQAKASAAKSDAERAAAERALVDLRAEHQALAERHESEKAALESEKAALESISAKKDEAAAAHAHISKQLEEAEAQGRAAIAAQAQAEAERELAEAGRQQADEARAQAQAAAEEALADLEQARSAHEDVAERRAAIDRQLAEFEAARKSAEERAAQAQADLSELEGRIETAQVEVDKRQQQLRALQSQVELAQAKAKEEAAKVNEALNAAEQAESLRAKREAEAEALAQRVAILEASIQESLSREQPARRAGRPAPLPPLPREEPEGFQPLARADAWAAAGDYTRAASSYRQVLEENPDDAGASYHLACILADRFEDFDSAETLLADAARLRPDHVATQYRQAVVMAQTGRIVQGVAKLLGLVRQDESNAEFVDQFVERMENDALRGDPEAKFRLGVAYRELGRVEEALVAFQGIQREQEFVVKCLIAIGLCLRRQGLDGAAAKRFSKALETPGYPEAQYHEALYHLADLYEAKGTQESLRLALSSLEELYSSDISYLDVGERIRAVKAKLEMPDSSKVTRLPTRHAEPGDR